MASDTAKFHFLRFFFSLKGRVSRRAFAAVVIPERLLVWGGNLLIHRPELHLTFMQTTIATAIFGLVALLLLWPRYAVTVKRLHDCGFPSQLALIHLLHLGVAICQTISVLIDGDAGRPINTQYWHLTLTVLFYTILAGVFLLSFVPGAKGSNRYGPPPRGPEIHAADIF